MNPGRKPEEAPEGMMLPREAAEVLEVSPETVKKYVREGLLLGEYGPNEAGEIRYYAAAQAVYGLKIERMETQTLVKRAGELHTDTQEVLLRATNRQREEVVRVVSRLDKIEQNQREIFEVVKDALERMDAQAKQEKEYQERALRAMERPWWKRLFGIE